MIKYSEEFFKKSFSADDMKSAYLSAVKWYSTNVLSKAEFVNVHVQFVKEDKTEFPTITIHLFAVQDGEKDVMAHHCNCCREMHKSFFINEDTNCNRCSALGFQKRLEQKINIKQNYYKELLRRHGGTDK
jgi:1-deoxy-D-xylulose 5-phosphate reductoisomerase